MSQNIHKKFTERQNQVRLYIIQFIVSEGRAFHLEADKELLLERLCMAEAEYRGAVKALIQQDGMVVDEEGRQVNFIYPVSAMKTMHSVTLADGRSFSAMCAIDAIGAAFTFQQDTEVHSVCAVCEEPVWVKIVRGKVADYTPRSLYALTFSLGEIENWAGSC